MRKGVDRTVMENAESVGQTILERRLLFFFFSDMRCDFSAKLGSMTSNMCCFLLFSFAFCYI